MIPTFHASGNRFSHVVHTGYRHSARVPGKLHPAERPRGWLKRLLRIA